MINQVNQSNLSVPTSQVNQGQNIELYPGNWLYNAGVVGFLNVINATNISNFNVKYLFSKDGSIKGDLSIIFNNTIQHNGYTIPSFIRQYFIESGLIIKKDFNINLKNPNFDPIKDIWGTLFNVYYRGFFNADSNILYQPTNKGKILFVEFINFINNLFVYNNNNSKCNFCLNKGTQTYKNKFTSEHSKELGSNDENPKKSMPNAFWNNNKNTNGLNICDTCSFLILHQHLAFTNLSDNTKIFINAPSFELMYELNKLIKELSKIDYKSTKELLAMSVIEYSLKINTILGNWLLMNIEIVAIDKKNNIEFINIPYNVLRIISNKKIAALLSDIGEFKILNIVLNEKYSELVEIAYRIMRIALKSKRNENDNKFLQDTIFLDKNKGSNYNLLWFSNKILNLYALIKETIKIK